MINVYKLIGKWYQARHSNKLSFQLHCIKNDWNNYYEYLSQRFLKYEKTNGIFNDTFYQSNIYKKWYIFPLQKTKENDDIFNLYVNFGMIQKNYHS